MAVRCAGDGSSGGEEDQVPDFFLEVGGWIDLFDLVEVFAGPEAEHPETFEIDAELVVDGGL